MENLSPDYELLLAEGLEGRLKRIDAELHTPDLAEEETDFLLAAHKLLRYVLAFSDRYAATAEASGNLHAAALLHRVPRHPAETLCEALQSIYFFSAMLRLANAMHCGFARMDQYLLDYYRADLAAQRETPDSARELFTEFFLKLNRDADLFDGMQPGDNGQTVMLGGCTRDGANAENELTLLLLAVSTDLAVIEPKINLRITKNMSEECLLAAARLAGSGLGFPQYCNDDVVIPGLTAFGYPLEDARDYTVAACWEYVVKNGRDVPNIYSVNLALAADRAIRKGLAAGEDFEQIKGRLAGEIRTLLKGEMSKQQGVRFSPNPLFSALCGDAVEKHHDLNVSGGHHRHFGCHGCGSSTAADSLAAIQKFIFDERSVSPETLLRALNENYENDVSLRRKLIAEGPHVGCNSPLADKCLCFVFDTFADVLNEVQDNGYGGRIRPGTGSAMNYVEMTQHENPQRLRATADGRKDGEFISSSLAPAPGVAADGILSVFNSYSKLNYRRLCNGGPITMELSPDYFRSPVAIQKTAAVLRAFHASHCQQLQLNILNKTVLRHAQQHPEQHRDLVVRVWGWSGYFVELDKAFQNQIIERQAFKG